LLCPLYTKQSKHYYQAGLHNLEIGTMSTPSVPAKRQSGWLVPILGGAWILLYFAARFLLEKPGLEALAVAYPLAMVLLMTLVLMQRAVILKFEDWSYAHGWIYLPIFYFAGLALARKRYA
jgi:hypothetical protein